MNYWVGMGLLFIALGAFFRVTVGRAKRRGITLDGSGGEGIFLQYLLPPIGLLFVIIGLVEMAR